VRGAGYFKMIAYSNSLQSTAKERAEGHSIQTINPNSNALA
jgi:hypothetical protein